MGEEKEEFEDWEAEMDTALRPRYLRQFVGQVQTRSQLDVVLESAKMRKECPEHTLISGPPGLGKTTLSEIIANELGVGFHPGSGPALAKLADLVTFMCDVPPGGVLFIDEIHRLPKQLHEILYPAMEDFRLEVPVPGKSAGETRKVRFPLPRFTLIGATTRPALLSPPLVDRFGIPMKLDYYTIAELVKILLRSAKLLGLQCNQRGAVEIARRSRGTPRVANQLLRRVRDFSITQAGGNVDAGVAKDALDLFEVDPAGLNKLDRQILRAMIERFAGGPVGLETMAAAVGEEKDTLADIVEPYMMRAGFLARTQRGRVATDQAYVHLGYSVPTQKNDRRGKHKAA